MYLKKLLKEQSKTGVGRLIVKITVYFSLDITYIDTAKLKQLKYQDENLLVEGKGLDLEDIQVPFQPKQLYNSFVNSIIL